MPQTHRSSEIKRGLSFTFTLMTWLTIGPAVALGLTITGLFALFVGHIDGGDLAMVAVFGAVAMGICAIPGSYAWRYVFKRRVLEPLRDLPPPPLVVRPDQHGIVPEQVVGLSVPIRQWDGHTRRLVGRFE